MTFALDVSKMVANTNKHLLKKVRGTLYGVSSRVIKGTPVGNPDLWIYNAGTKENPRYVDYIAYNGKPDGYIGGTLRGAWTASLNAKDSNLTKVVDKSGNDTIAKVKIISDSLEIGDTFFLTNAQPYAYRVEMTGWSTQAPAGMLRIALADTQAVINAL